MFDARYMVLLLYAVSVGKGWLHGMGVQWHQVVSNNETADAPRKP